MLNSINDVQTLIAGIIKPEHTVYLPNIIGITQRDLRDYTTKVELASKLNGYVTKENLNDYATKKYVDGKLQYPSNASFSEVWADYLHAWRYFGVADDEGCITEIFRSEGIEGDTTVYLPTEDGTLLTEEKAEEMFVPVDVITATDHVELYGRTADGTVRGYSLAAAIKQSNNGCIPVYQSGTSDLIPNAYLYTGTPTSDGMAANKKYVDDAVHKPYRLIETITLTEDTAMIERSQEPDGTAYNFKDMFISFYCTNDMPAGSVTNSKEWVKCWFNYGEKRFCIFRETTLGIAASTAKYRSFIKTENEGNLKRSIMTKGYINYGYSNSETQADGNLEWLFTTNNLTKIQLEHQSNFLPGIVIEIWATDA